MAMEVCFMIPTLRIVSLLVRFLVGSWNVYGLGMGCGLLGRDSSYYTVDLYIRC